MNAATTTRDEIRRVLIAGDAHGNAAWIETLTTKAAEQACPVIIQVGDFGYFPDRPWGPRFLSAVDTACRNNGVELWFIDGNHDDHFARAQHRESEAPVAVTDRVTYIPRGARMTLGSRAFGFLGGAFSVDWRDRTHGLDWWSNERTDLGDVARLGEDWLDILITHDAPDGIEFSARRLPAEDRVRTDEVRALITEAVEATLPRLVLHGHWHHAHDTELSWIDRAATERSGALTWQSTSVIGLTRDGGSNDSWLVLDVDTPDVHRPTVRARRVEPTSAQHTLEVDS